MSGEPTLAEHWEARYTHADQVWSGRVNRVLADTVEPFASGTALDLGCGEGGDAVWLAQRGWRVTGVDVSATAVARGRAAGAALGLEDDALRLEAADLSAWEAPERYDLVTASFLHSWPVEIPRDEILHRATGFVAPGGRMLVVSHAEAPPWADLAHGHAHPFPTPESDLAALQLDLDGWRVLACERRERAATAPDGTPSSLVDGVVLVQRLADA